MKKFNLIPSIKKFCALTLVATMVCATPVVSTPVQAASVVAETTMSEASSTMTITLGTTKQFAKTAGYKYSFKIKNTKIASVSTSGKVTAKKNGTTTMTVTSKKKIAGKWRTVESEKIKIKVTNKISVKVGKSVKIAVKNAKFSSSDKSVATVSKSGSVKGKKPGTVTITAKVGKKSYKYNVTVSGKKVWVVDKEAWTEVIEHEEEGHWEQVWHDAVYERVYVPDQQVLVKEAWTEEVVTPAHYETVVVEEAVYGYACCRYCGQWFETSAECLAHKDEYRNAAYEIWKNTPDAEWASVKEEYDALNLHAISSWFTGCSSEPIKPAVTEQVWVEEEVEYIEHPAEYKTIWAHFENVLVEEAGWKAAWVVDEEAWTETIYHEEEGHWEYK